jgi:hypothetical protein
MILTGEMWSVGGMILTGEMWNDRGNVERWWNDTDRGDNCFDTNQWQWHCDFIHHKFHTDFSVIESGPNHIYIIKSCRSCPTENSPCFHYKTKLVMLGKRRLFTLAVVCMLYNTLRFRNSEMLVFNLAVRILTTGHYRAKPSRNLQKC